MNSIRITVIRVADYADLSARYELPQREPCSMRVGQTFRTTGAVCPAGFCPAAWRAIQPYAQGLLGEGGLYIEGWMRDPRSAMVSCDDGFRPVSFLVERID